MQLTGSMISLIWNDKLSYSRRKFVFVIARTYHHAIYLLLVIKLKHTLNQTIGYNLEDPSIKIELPLQNHW